MVNLSVTFAVGLIFGYAFYKMKVPGGMMVGAIVGVAVLNIFFDMAYMPSYAKYAAQISAGAFIGCSVEKSDIQHLKQVVKPALLLLGSMLMLNITLGFIIYFTSPLDLLTSLMSSVPGGMSDIPIISADMGADAPKVAALQFTRMLAGIGLFPTLISMVARRDSPEDRIPEKEKTTPTEERGRSNGHSATAFIQTISVATASGILGKTLNIPAGILIFSMLGVLCFKLLDHKTYMPMWAKRLAQVLSGAYIGGSVIYSDIVELKYLVIPALILLLGYFATCLLLGKALSKHFDMSIKEAMLVATPAGAADMALISSDLGVESTDLILLQIIRLLVVLSVFPQIISLIVKHIGGV